MGIGAEEEDGGEGVEEEVIQDIVNVRDGSPATVRDGEMSLIKRVYQRDMADDDQTTKDLPDVEAMCKEIMDPSDEQLMKMEMEEQQKIEQMDNFEEYCVETTQREMIKHEKEMARSTCQRTMEKDDEDATEAPAFEIPTISIKWVTPSLFDALGITLPPEILELGKENREIGDEEVDEVSRKSPRSDVNLELLSKLNDNIVLVDKIKFDDEKDEATDQVKVEELFTLLGVQEHGTVEKIFRIESRRGTRLLVQVDSSNFRDEIIKSYRSGTVRETLPAKLRKPKVKDMKHIISLVMKESNSL